jgi:predicted DNA-binding antitoxin AbrB/MazE fold protein
MFQHILAIFEDGVLKPLTPLTLEEHQRVCVSISLEAEDLSDHAELVARQRRAMEALDAEMATLPDNSPADGRTAADHDTILYGQPE